MTCEIQEVEDERMKNVFQYMPLPPTRNRTDWSRAKIRVFLKRTNFSYDFFLKDIGYPPFVLPSPLRIYS